MLRSDTQAPKGTRGNQGERANIPQAVITQGNVCMHVVPFLVPTGEEGEEDGWMEGGGGKRGGRQWAGRGDRLESPAG